MATIRKPNMLSRLKHRSRRLHREALTMYLAIRHPATPWYAKVAAGAVVLAPMDLPTLRALTLDVLLHLGVVDMVDNQQEDKGNVAEEAVA